jgi:hypothetical protein
MMAPSLILVAVRLFEIAAGKMSKRVGRLAIQRAVGLD